MGGKKSHFSEKLESTLPDCRVSMSVWQLDIYFSILFIFKGRVQMTAAAFAKGLLALEGELTPILVQMVKSAHTNGLLDNETDGSSKYQNM